MYFYELEKKIKELPNIPGSDLSLLHRIVIAVYREDYDQKRDILIDDAIPGISLEEVLKYGIFSKVGNYSSVTYSREYIIFIDDKIHFTSEDSFVHFADMYCKSYLPSGVNPTMFAFLFSIESYEEYEKYISMLVHYFKGIQPFFTFSELIRSNRKQESLNKTRKMFEDSYNIYVFDEGTYKKLFSFFYTEKQGDFIFLFKQALDNFAHSLEKNTLILGEYYSSIQKEQNIIALALAYLTFKYKIPVYSEGAILNNYVSKLKSFYCNFDVYTAYDKIQYLLNFPIISFSKRSLVDFLVYIYPNKRQLLTKIFYLDDDRNLINEKIEIAKYHIYDDCRKECYFNELVKLEDSLEDSKFLHIGNCLILEIKGKKRVAFLEEIDAKFLSIAYSCDPTIKPFTYTLNSFDLTNMLPWESLHFHKGKSGFSLQEKFIAFLNQQQKKQRIPALDFKNNLHFYVPSYALDGLGCIIEVMTELYQSQLGFSEVSQNMMDLYSFYQVTMRNSMINRLSDIISLNRLRHQSNYLTLYGASTFLLLNEELLRTRK